MPSSESWRSPSWHAPSVMTSWWSRSASARGRMQIGRPGMWRCDCPPDDCTARVQEYLDGRRDAGDALVRKFTPLVDGVVRRVLGRGRREEWEDAGQAVFLRVFANLGHWGG